MEIKVLKEQIENKQSLTSCIFVCKDDQSRFIPYQYINEYSKYSHKQIKTIEDINDLLFPTYSMFGEIEDKSNIYLFVCDKLAALSEEIYNKAFTLFIIAKELDDELLNKYNDVIIICPKLTESNIRGYAYVAFDGVNNNRIDWFLKCCKFDIFRVDNESRKFNIFDTKERDALFLIDQEEGNFYNLIDKTIFSLTDSLVKKDLEEVKNIWKNIDKIDINPIGFVTVLINNFRSIIDIQLNKKASPESLKMNPKQFAAIKYRTGYYSQQQLISIYEMLLEIDLQLKLGKMPVDLIVPYIILKILDI